MHVGNRVRNYMPIWRSVAILEVVKNPGSGWTDARKSCNKIFTSSFAKKKNLKKTLFCCFLITFLVLFHWLPNEA